VTSHRLAASKVQEAEEVAEGCCSTGC